LRSFSAISAMMPMVSLLAFGMSAQTKSTLASFIASIKRAGPDHKLGQAARSWLRERVGPHRQL
jgi:hypothetical protein